MPSISLKPSESPSLSLSPSESPSTSLSPSPPLSGTCDTVQADKDNGVFAHPDDTCKDKHSSPNGGLGCFNEDATYCRFCKEFGTPESNHLLDCNCIKQDSTAWAYVHFDGNIGDCTTVASDTGSLCAIYGTDGSMAADACPFTCGCNVPTLPPSTSLEPSKSPSLSQNPSAMPSLSSSPSNQPSISSKPSEVPSISLSPTPGIEDSATNRPTLSVQPSKAPSISSEPSKTPSVSLEPSESPSVSSAPSSEPSRLPSQSPSSFPSSAPSERPSLSQHPSSLPSVSLEPSESPSVSSAPSSKPSRLPSQSPSLSQSPSSLPSISTNPSSTPSVVVADTKTASPTVSLQPSMSPSISLLPSDQPSVSQNPSSAPSLSSQPSWIPSNQPSLSIEPSELPSAQPSMSSAPSSTPSLSSEPSEEPSNQPSISLQPSQQPSMSIAPSNSPSLSLEPSLEPTEALIIEELCNLNRYFQSPSMSSTETAKGFAIDFVPKVDMQLVGVQLHLSNIENIWVEIHIREGVFGINGGYIELYSGRVDGRGMGLSTNLASIKRRHSQVLKAGKNYALYIWTDSNSSILTRRGNQPASSDISFTNVTTLLGFSQPVNDSNGYLWQSGLTGAEHVMEGILDFCQDTFSNPDSSVSMSPSSYPSISAMPSPRLDLGESPSDCEKFFLSPMSLTKKSRGFIIDFEPKKAMKITGFEFRLESTLMLLDIHIKEGLFGIGDGFEGLASGYVVGEGGGSSTNVGDFLSISKSQVLEPSTKYSLYIWSDDWTGFYAGSGNAPSNSDFHILRVSRLSNYSNRVDHSGRLDESGTIEGNYIMEGSIKYCLV